MVETLSEKKDVKRSAVSKLVGGDGGGLRSELKAENNFLASLVLLIFS